MKTFAFHVFCAAIVRRFETICVNLQLQNRNGSVAQLNRASDSGSEGRGFESHRNHQGVQLSQLHLFYFGAERLGREKVLKVVGLNPTGITKGVQLSQLHLFYFKNELTCLLYQKHFVHLQYLKYKLIFVSGRYGKLQQTTRRKKGSSELG